ncbi:MAG: hypothetical protein MUP09_02375, partial [Thiovulaceae bacterium]|nr:hypothetical protein [Sulfurimonadaceae bacterium]
MNRQLLETIRVQDGQPLNLLYHQQRVSSSLKQLGYDAHYDLASRIKAPDSSLYRCRIVYDAITFAIDYLPYKKRAVRRLQLVQADGLDYALKFADRSALEQLFERKEGSDDILIVQGTQITDTSIANIAFFDGEQW